ncbi:MAG: hypothetical protein Kow00106_14280 [Anaerolineae bacterium]
MAANAPILPGNANRHTATWPEPEFERIFTRKCRARQCPKKVPTQVVSDVPGAAALVSPSALLHPACSLSPSERVRAKCVRQSARSGLPHPHSALTRLAAPSPRVERGRAERSEAGGEVNTPVSSKSLTTFACTRRNEGLVVGQPSIYNERNIWLALARIQHR